MPFPHRLFTGNGDPVPASQLEALEAMTEGAARWCATRGVPVPRSLSVVLLANAWEESRWRPSAVGDGGASIGLFQLHTVGGVGRPFIEAGYTKQDLMDPHLNTAAILAEMEREGSTVQALQTGTVLEAVRVFCVRVERPRNSEAAALRRQRFASSIVGGSLEGVLCREFG